MGFYTNVYVPTFSSGLINKAGNKCFWDFFLKEWKKNTQFKVT